MATITEFKWHEMDVEDRRDSTANILRNKIILKTNERVTWTDLRTMSPVPKWGDEHPTERGFYLDHCKPTHKSKLVWELETEYTPFKAGQIDPDPIARPATLTYSSSLIEQPTLFDSKERPVVNRAGEFIQGIMKQVPLIEYGFSKNFSADPSWLQTHIGAVNSDTIKLRGLIWKPRTLLLSAAAGGEFVTENRSRYTSITGTILADYRTWTQEVWNLGTVQLKEVTLKVERKDLPGFELKKVWQQIPIMAGDPAEPVTEPVPLDEDGRYISDALQRSTSEPMTKSRLITLKFDIQHEMPFSELPLR